MRPEPLPVPASDTTAVQPAATKNAPVGRLPMFHVIGFTGHRHLTNTEAAAAAIREALDTLRQEISGEWIALSSIADGADRLFVHQARLLGMSWHAILPLPRAEFAKDFSEAEWADVEMTLEAADHVRILEEAGDRDESYLDCGIETVNGADVLLAVWDGNPARGKGGTADVVQYARSISKPVLIVNPETHEVRRENWHRLEPNDPVLADLNALPEATSAWAMNPFKAPAEVFLFQQKCDYHATQGAPQFRRLIVATVMAHVCASLAGATVVAYELHSALLACLELALISFALGAVLALRRKMHSHHNWVRCRLAAEFCRSALATWGLPRAAPLLQDLDLAGARGLTRSLYVLHTRSSATRPVPIDEFKRIYLEKRIDDQLHYYNRQMNRAFPLYKRLATGFSVATISALVSTAFYASSTTLHWPVPAWIAGTTNVFLPIALPALAAAAISIISINDFQRRVARYREMRQVLEESRSRVTSCRTWNSIEQVVLKTERALLQEVIEWHSVRSFSGGSH